MLELIPRKAMKKINISGDLAQLEGFEDLFVYLDKPDEDNEYLRQRIANYFESYADLRVHLSKICFPQLPSCTDADRRSNCYPVEKKGRYASLR